MRKMFWFSILLLIPGLCVADDDVCVHLNGGDDVAYIGEYNTFEIWISNDLALSGVQFPLEICWPSDTTLWIWATDYGSNPPFNRHGDAIDHLLLFASEVNFDNASCETFAAGAASLGQDLPPGPSRLCYSLQFGLISDSELADAIEVRPYAYFGSYNWFFDPADFIEFPPDFCGQTVGSMHDPVASPVTFSIIRRPQTPCGDVDCNDIVNIADAVYLISYIFGGGAAPCAGCP
jgi:hypothetical protein